MSAENVVGNLDVDCLYGRGGRCCFSLIAAKGAGLKSCEIGWLDGEGDVCGKFALKHLPRKKQLLALFVESDNVADERAAHCGDELRSEVAHLIGVRHQHQRGLL